MNNLRDELKKFILQNFEDIYNDLKNAGVVFEEVNKDTFIDIPFEKDTFNPDNNEFQTDETQSFKLAS